MTRWLIQLMALLTLFGLVAFASGFNSLAAQAAEAPADTPADEPTSEADREPDQASAPSSEVFIPTEEISEDFAVSFPVDI